MIQSFLGYAQESQTRWLGLLEKLVNVDSGSRDLEGLEVMRELLEDAWRGLGFHVEVTETGTGPQLVARHNSPNPDAPTVMLIGHTDTVFDRGTARERPFTIKDGRAYGPGVADMKGGDTVIFAAAETLKHFDLLDLVNIIVVHNCDEEISSKNSRDIMEVLANEADAAFVFEAGRLDGSIVTDRKGGQAYTLEVFGKAAHAGVNPQEGASAIEALCRKTIDLHALTNYDTGLTINVVITEGGSRSNVVADYACAAIDVRTPTVEIAEQVQADIQAIAEREEIPGTSSKLIQTAERGPMVLSDATRPLLEMHQRNAKALGFEIGSVATGGGSDGNFTAAKGVPTLDGLGPIGGFYHSTDEYMEVDSLAPRAALAAALIAQLPELFSK